MQQGVVQRTNARSGSEGEGKGRKRSQPHAEHVVSGRIIDGRGSCRAFWADLSQFAIFIKTFRRTPYEGKQRRCGRQDRPFIKSL